MVSSQMVLLSLLRLLRDHHEESESETETEGDLDILTRRRRSFPTREEEEREREPDINSVIFPVCRRELSESVGQLIQRLRLLPCWSWRTAGRNQLILYKLIINYNILFLLVRPAQLIIMFNAGVQKKKKHRDRFCKLDQRLG